MGRTRSFDEATVVDAAAAAFLDTGFEGTSVDDLLTATGLFRGSLYKAFGSKRGLFLTCVQAVAARAAADAWQPADTDVDLLLVALLDVAPTDPEVRDLCTDVVRQLPGHRPDLLLGARLLARAGVPVQLPTAPEEAR